MAGNEFFLDKILNSRFSRVNMLFNIGPDFWELVKSFGTAESKLTSISGYLVSDTTSMSTSTGWSDLSDGDGLKNIISKIPGVGELAAQVYEGAMDFINGAAGKSQQYKWQTIQAWQGSEKPQFSIELLFVHSQNNAFDRPENKAALLSAMCLPKMEGDFMFAPNGYKPAANVFNHLKETYVTGEKSPVTGTCTLCIGEWFVAPLLLLQEASFEYSKECAPDGSPLYAQGSVNFVSSRAIAYDEYLSWFIKRTASI